MLRTLVVCVAVAAACACSRGAERRASSAVDAATAALRRGDPIAAESLIAPGLEAAAKAPDSELSWRLRLLRADALLARRDLQGATAMGQSPPPDGPAFVEIRARQKYLQARLAHARGR